VLSFLLDEQISPLVAEQLSKKRPDINILSAHTWQQGIFRAASDEVLLTAAREASLTLITYDLRTIPPLLRQWGDLGLSHAGVIFIDHRSIPSNQFGTLIKTLIWLWDAEHQSLWLNRIVFLQPQAP
jgi:predicted nuclease of predicted toxin-antitoxin system